MSTHNGVALQKSLRKEWLTKIPTPAPIKTRPSTPPPTKDHKRISGINFQGCVCTYQYGSNYDEKMYCPRGDLTWMCQLKSGSKRGIDIDGGLQHRIFGPPCEVSTPAPTKTPTPAPTKARPSTPAATKNCKRISGIDWQGAFSADVECIGCGAWFAIVMWGILFC